MATILDVARAAGVSKSTASRALSGHAQVADETRARVERASAELGFRPTPAAVKLAKGSPRAIGVVTPTVERWYFSTLLAGIAEAARESGHDVVLYDLGALDETSRDAVEHFLERVHVDGIVAVTVPLDGETAARIEALGVPMLVIGHDDQGSHTMSLDDEAAGHALATHLLSLGHRDIQPVTGAVAAGSWFDRGSSARLAGARAALEGEDAVLRDPVMVPPSMWGAHDVDAVFSDPLPTAVLAVSDEIAIGTLAAALERGIRVPEDLSIVGVDDHPFAASLGITTVRQDPRQQGRDAVAWVLAHTRDPDAPSSHRSIPPELIVRTSTAPPRR